MCITASSDGVLLAYGTEQGNVASQMYLTKFASTEHTRVSQRKQIQEIVSDYIHEDACCACKSLVVECFDNTIPSHPAACRNDFHCQHGHW